ncbi:sialoadhesin isoform X2 [Oncorhynchus kisutch]|uniref:sialoadhesin isoform X2 n=1 Tax=Oncorhynchus kisutch TaxID=8019 RepID=UPI0012DC56D4|nr:sialoadhesin isoform X2 [Oncorhynchus kisutch]
MNFDLYIQNSEGQDCRVGDATMALRTAGSVLGVFVWSVAVVLGQDGWSVKYTTQSICVLKGSTVELTCSYTYPSGYTVTTTFWFTKYNAVGPVSLSDDPDYKGRVTYRKDKENEHTLTITDLRESDSATYKFRFTDQTGKWRYTGEPGVTLSVTGLQVKVTGGHQDKTLTCSTTCTLTDNPTYIWYKNGQHLDESTSPQYKDPVSSNYEDSYSCAVKGHEDLHSPAVCVQGQDCNIVTYTKRTICALKGSTVDISCTYGSGYDTVTSSLWFSSKQKSRWRDKLMPEDLTTDPGYAGRVEYVGEKERGRSTLRITDLRITDLREEDSAEYKFIFNTQTSRWGHSFPGTTLTVTDLQVKVTPATEAGKRTLTCITTCTLTDNPTYIWYKNGHKVKEDTSRLDSDSFSDADSYSCAVKGYENIFSPAVCQKCWSVTYTHQSICALKGTTVDISCSYTYPSYHEIKKAFWFTKWSGRDPEDLSSVPGYEGHIEYLGDKESDCTLRITDLRLSDSAGYRFRLITSGEMVAGSPVSLTVSDVVLEMDPTSVSERENVTLRCRTKCTLVSNTAYSWYKNRQPIPNSNTSSPVYILFSVSSEDTGRYSCAVEGHEDLPSAEETLTVRYGPKNTSVSLSPSGEIVEGSSVTLTCSSDANPPVDIYTWYKKNGGGYQSMTGPQHVFKQIQSSDSGEYYCEAQNEMGTDMSRTINMDVKYTPKNTSVSVSPSREIVEGSSVTLTCSSDANPPVDKYTWYQKNVTSPKASGQSYSITNIISEDRGEYYCEAENKYGRLNSSSVSVDVQYGPKNTSVSVSPSGEIVEGSSVTLTCSSDANPPVDKYTWYKKNATSPKASGQSYSITNISSEDRGEYYCEAQNGRGSMNSTALMIIIAGKQTSVVTAAVGIIVVVLVLILCFSGFMWFRRSTGGSDATADTQSVRPDCNSDTYTGLNMRTMSPDYDTLISVHPDPNSDTYTPLNMKTRSPEYDTLANVRGISH